MSRRDVWCTTASSRAPSSVSSEYAFPMPGRSRSASWTSARVSSAGHRDPPRFARRQEHERQDHQRDAHRQHDRPGDVGGAEPERHRVVVTSHEMPLHADRPTTSAGDAGVARIRSRRGAPRLVRRPPRLRRRSRERSERRCAVRRGSRAGARGGRAGSGCGVAGGAGTARRARRRGPGRTQSGARRGSAVRAAPSTGVDDGVGSGRPARRCRSRRRARCARLRGGSRARPSAWSPDGDPRRGDQQDGEHREHRSVLAPGGPHADRAYRVDAPTRPSSARRPADGASVTPYSRAMLANFTKWSRKASRATPVGPFRCLADDDLGRRRAGRTPGCRPRRGR